MGMMLTLGLLLGKLVADVGSELATAIPRQEFITSSCVGLPLNTDQKLQLVQEASPL